MYSYRPTVFPDNPISRQCPGPHDQLSLTYNRSSPTIKSYEKNNAVLKEYILDFIVQ